MHKTDNSKLNLQGKLRLKRSDSTQAISNSDVRTSFDYEARPATTYDQSFQKENFKSSSEEDSLADFKSPKKETVRKPVHKYKIDAGKTKKKIAISKAKSAVKSKRTDANQPSIEASLFKPLTSHQNQTNIKEAVPCPVCLKPFKDDTTCTSHMKSCAAKNNVSIKQLLEAKRLQERQAQERKAIGLLAAPIIPEKKKAFQSRNFSTGDDPQLQLVLAMSESLYEADKIVELEEAAFLAGIPTECITALNEEERKTLQSFGFTTNKPMADIPTNKLRRKKLLAPTVLQTRSREDKDRVLTERIACILTGEDALTQAPEKTAISLEHGAPTSIRSRLLKKIEKKDDKLWDKSRLTRPFHDLYFTELKSHFVKSTEQQQPVESKTQELLAPQDYGKQDAQTLNTSFVYEPMDLDIIINNQEVEGDTTNCGMFNMSEPKRDNFESEFVQNFVNGWKEALNDSSVSDLVILVKNNKCIYAHKLVFHIQCPSILLDIEPLKAVITSPIEQKISWLDKEELPALAFLEFIYSGTINKYISIFHSEELVHQVDQLARLYRKQDLLTYVREKQQEFLFAIRPSKQLGNKRVTNEFPHKSYDPKKNKSIRLETQVTQNNPQGNIHCAADKLDAKNVFSTNAMTAEQLNDRRITASPDLFDSEEDEANSSRAIENSKNDALAKSNIKEEIDELDEVDHFNSQKTLVNLSRSVSPMENIHEAITPPSKQSPKGHGKLEDELNNEREIAEAVTPKCQSPERKIGMKQEVIESDDLASAVTPEYSSPTELGADHVTPKKIVYAAMPTQDLNIDESIYTAVTPPRLLQEESDQMTVKNVHKIKSELTMFIEKVQRRNAKDIMDTDSETDSPHNNRRKNPFLKRDQDDSYRYLRNNRDEQNHKAISLLEKDMLDEQEHHENVEINLKGQQIQNGSDRDVSLSDDQVEDVTVDETEMSMYTKYRKSHKSENSIALYRKQLGFDGQEKTGTNDKVARSKATAEEDSNDSITDSRSCSTISQSATVKKPKPRIIEDVTLVSDSDEEESPLRTLVRDVSIKKIYRSGPVVDMSNRDSITFPLDPSENSKVFSSTVSKEESKNKVIDLSVDSDDGGIHDDRSIASSRLLAQSYASLNNPKTLIMEIQTSIDKRKELEKAEKKSEDIDAEISKILQSSQEIIHENSNSDPGQVVVESTEEFNENKEVVLSPISIASSPEPYELGKVNSIRRRKEKKKNANDIKCYNYYSQNSESSLTLGENGDFDVVLPCNDWSVKTPPKKTARSMKSPEKSSRVSSSPSIRKLNCGVPPLNSTESGCLKGDSNENRPSSGDVQGSASKTSDKLESAFTPSSTGRRSGGQADRPSLQRSSSFATPGQDTMDYASLDTPNLQKQLRKFGLKPQSRTRATALLTHIYKETRCQSAASQKRTSNTGGSSSSEEDEPPAKRQYVKSVTKRDLAITNDEHYSRAEKNGSVIAEEMDLDEPDVASGSQNPVSIRDAFFKLIKTNRELYDQVLTYEPLALESLHSTLKQNGFKCQLNSLMNFLDEQCITFQVKANKGDRVKK